MLFYSHEHLLHFPQSLASFFVLGAHARLACGAPIVLEPRDAPARSRA